MNVYVCSVVWSNNEHIIHLHIGRLVFRGILILPMIYEAYSLMLTESKKMIAYQAMPSKINKRRNTISEKISGNYKQIYHPSSCFAIIVMCRFWFTPLFGKLFYCFVNRYIIAHLCPFTVWLIGWLSKSSRRSCIVWTQVPMGQCVTSNNSWWTFLSGGSKDVE